ncbi:hypothetical protein ACHAPJ_011037 [Fusarium lateritium]
MYRRRGGSTQSRSGRGRGNYTPGAFKQQNKPHQGGITLVDSMSLRSIRQDSQPDPPSLKVVSNSKGGGRQDNIIAKVPGLQTTYAATINNQQSLLEIYNMMPGKKLSIIVAVAPVGGNDVPTTTTELDWSILQGRLQSPPAKAKLRLNLRATAAVNAATGCHLLASGDRVCLPSEQFTFLWAIHTQASASFPPQSHPSHNIAKTSQTLLFTKRHMDNAAVEMERLNNNIINHIAEWVTDDSIRAGFGHIEGPPATAKGIHVPMALCNSPLTRDSGIVIFHILPSFKKPAVVLERNKLMRSTPPELLSPTRAHLWPLTYVEITTFLKEAHEGGT